MPLPAPQPSHLRRPFLCALGTLTLLALGTGGRLLLPLGLGCCLPRGLLRLQETGKGGGTPQLFLSQVHRAKES